MSDPQHPDPVREALDNVLEALERVSYSGEAGNVEDLDNARHEGIAALADSPLESIEPEPNKPNTTT